MSRREQILLVAGAILVILLGFYYVIYVPRTNEYRELAAEREARQTRLDQMRRVAARAEQLERRYQELQTFIATIEAKLPTEKEVPALLVQLERLTTSLRVNLQAIRPGSLEAVTAGQNTQPAAGQPPAGGAAQPGGQGQPEYFRFPIGLSFEATYNEFVALMAALRDFPRLIAVTRVGMAPGKVPELGVTVDTQTYVLPKEAR